MHDSVILYAEDEEFDVLFLKHAFAEAGIANLLRVVANGRQAIDYLAGRGAYADRQKYPLPGVVLLDLNLPYQTGFEVLNWIRQQPGLSSLVVLVYTSSDQPQDIEQAYACHANGYLLKPSDPDQLCAMVKALKEYWLVHNLPPSCCADGQVAAA